MYNIFIPTLHLVDFYGKCREIYNRPMHGIWVWVFFPRNCHCGLLLERWSLWKPRKCWALFRAWALKNTRPSAGVVSLPETKPASLPLKVGLLPQTETIVFQPSIFRCELFVFGGCRSSMFVAEGICCPKVWLSLQSIFQITTVAPYSTSLAQAIFLGGFPTE